LLKSKRSAALVSIIAVIGVSLLIGDGVITPAISILSAVEGSVLIPGLQSLSKTTIVLISMIIAVLLFVVQKKGTEKIAGAFGPLMSIWFVSLALSGIFAIAESPEIIYALNPYWGIKFLLENGLQGFIVLGEIILCSTGGEALYADMGHLGGKPIRQGWGGVLVELPGAGGFSPKTS
jgi:KUP system potassium uptake protein